MKIFLSNIMSF